MTGVVGPGAVAGRFAAAEHGADDGARTHVTEVGNRVEEFSTTGFEDG